MNQTDIKTRQESAIKKGIDGDDIKLALERFEKYKKGKSALDDRAVENEQFWKLRHWEGQDKSETKPTAWLWNVLLSKHADMMDGFPEANVRPKEPGDVKQAAALSQIIPVIYETNGFRKTYNKCCWDKLNKGTAIYAVLWDKNLLDGRGDVSIRKVDILNFFFEPGIEDIQQSRDIFITTVIDRERLEQMYPEHKGKFGSAAAISIKRYTLDDDVDQSDKCIVFDWYYKKRQGGKTVLHYCKFVDNVILYASENDTAVPSAPVIDPMTLMPAMSEDGQEIRTPVGKSVAEKGWYEHGKYPFVLDPLFTVAGTPCGYSYTDICKSAQIDIDLLNHSIIKNARMSAKTRYFIRADGQVNPTEFADMERDLVSFSGNFSQDSVIPIQVPSMPGFVVDVLRQKIEELKETSGNRDVNNGSSSSGVTAASAIAALQESAGKTSRDNLQNTYEVFKQITYLVIELIRQFYDSARYFRITGKDGRDEFVQYSNEAIKPQSLGNDFGMEMGYRVPQFDIEVSAQKATPYTKMSQNELALQFYTAGFFAPQNADMALSCLEMMDFQHKEDIISRIQQNSTMFSQLQALLHIALPLAAKYDPVAAQQIAAVMGANVPATKSTAVEKTEPSEVAADGTLKKEEHAFVKDARAQAQNSTQVG